MKIQDAPEETWLSRPGSNFSIIKLTDGSYQMWNGHISIHTWGLTSWEKEHSDWEALS